MIFKTIKVSNTFYFKPLKGTYYTLNTGKSTYKIKSFPSWDYRQSLNNGTNMMLAPDLMGVWQDD